MIVLYKCNLCTNEIKKLYQTADKQAPFLTCECGGVLEKRLPDFGFSSIEIVDNGNMSRSVELRKDAVQKFKEKGDQHVKLMETRDRILKKDD